MILADKIIDLRKKSGWSQEELAAQLGVSRQAVSKWEGAQSVPDLDRVLAMSRLFGVSTDYLLKDELEQAVPLSADAANDAQPPARRVDLEEASDYLALKRQEARRVAGAIILGMLAPMLFLVMGVMLSCTHQLTGLVTSLVGTLLLAVMAVTITTFCLYRIQMRAYHYLDKERIETAYGVSGMVRERMREFRPQYLRQHTMGITLIGICPSPIFILHEMQRLQWMTMDAAMLLGFFLLLGMVATGVALIFHARMVNRSFQRLLEEGRFTKDQKAVTASPWVTVYWCVVAAAFIGYALLTEDFRNSLIFLALMAVLYGGVAALIKARQK